MLKLNKCLIEYDKLFKTIYDDIWNKVRNIIKKNLILNPSAKRF